MSEQQDESDFVDAVRSRAASGQYLLALDLAQQGLEQHPDSFELKYEYTLELCRSGALHTGRTFYQGAFTEIEHLSPRVAALGARISKGLAAQMAPGSDRELAFADVGAEYEAIFESAGEPYTAVNAASMYLIGHHIERASTLAHACLAHQSVLEGSYYGVATLAEAMVVLGDYKAAGSTFERAAALPDADVASIATTRKQLRLLSATGALTESQCAILLDRLHTPTVVHFCGQMANDAGGIADLGPESISDIKKQLRAHIEKEQIRHAYGALAAGSDIIIAEVLLAAGVELNVVLPFPPEAFIETSVKPYGEQWVARFDACLARARRVEVASDEQFQEFTAVFRYATEQAMGLALLRSDRMDSDVQQLVIWDGAPGTRQPHGGTQHSLALWQQIGRRNVIFGAGDTQPDPADLVSEMTTAFGQRAMLFGDIKGFSKLLENQIPIFVNEVLGRFAKVLDSAGESVEFSNTWGDGIFVVCSTVTQAVHIAFDLQQTLRELDVAAVGLPADHALRLGGHFGPVLVANDPILKRNNYFGVHVSRAARIEPITPEGEIFVSQPFAAQLMLENSAEFTTEYVGVIPAAKSYGSLPMYLVKPRLNR